MFVVELDVQEQYKEITETYFSAPRQFGDDMFWIFDDLRFVK